MLLSLFHDQPPSAPLGQRFLDEHVLERLHALDAKARREGVAKIDPDEDPLIRLGM
ncbi:MAG TPA: hypothetical protein VG672_18580 [Bryobacteraceae bacterium]|nr:hypothetical protein [Bryobacteraceae bacterium]